MCLSFRGIKITVDKFSAVAALLMLTACIFISSLIPPFQSPDEHDHIERAYLLSRGQFILDTPEGGQSGGLIDSGLLKFSMSYPTTGKISVDMIDSANQIKWSGVRVFDIAPGTGYTFPLIYFPQAVGLFIGEKLELTVNYSYRLARLLALLTSVILVFLSFSISPPNPAALGILSMPMTLFQFSSATIDGLAVALALFSVAAFLRIVRIQDKYSQRLYPVLAICVGVLAGSKLNLLPMVALVGGACFFLPSRKNYLIFTGTFIAIFGWLVLAMKTTIDTRIVMADPPSKITIFYLQNPWAFFQVLSNTLSDPGIFRFYKHSFIGVLGWLNASFKTRIYDQFVAGLVILAILSVDVQRVKRGLLHSALVAGVSVISALLVFFALLIIWSPHPANVVSGVQGRYFIIPAVIFAYSLHDSLCMRSGWKRKTGFFLSIIFFIYSVLCTSDLLLDRYYSGL